MHCWLQIFDKPFVCSCYADACRVSNVEQTIQFNPICYDFVFFGYVCHFFSLTRLLLQSMSKSFSHCRTQLVFFSVPHCLLVCLSFDFYNCIFWADSIKNRAQWWYCIVADVSILLLFCTLIRYSYMIDMSTLSIMCLLYSLFFVIEQVIYCTKTVKEISNLLTVMKKTSKLVTVWVSEGTSVSNKNTENVLTLDI